MSPSFDMKAAAAALMVHYPSDIDIEDVIGVVRFSESEVSTMRGHFYRPKRALRRNRKAWKQYQTSLASYRQTMKVIDQIAKIRVPKFMRPVAQ